MPYFYCTLFPSMKERHYHLIKAHYYKKYVSKSRIILTFEPIFCHDLFMILVAKNPVLDLCFPKTSHKYWLEGSKTNFACFLVKESSRSLSFSTAKRDLQKQGRTTNERVHDIVQQQGPLQLGKVHDKLLLWHVSSLSPSRQRRRNVLVNQLPEPQLGSLRIRLKLL